MKGFKENDAGQLVLPKLSFQDDKRDGKAARAPIKLTAERQASLQQTPKVTVNMLKKKQKRTQGDDLEILKNWLTQGGGTLQEFVTALASILMAHWLISIIILVLSYFFLGGWWGLLKGVLLVVLALSLAAVGLKSLGEAFLRARFSIAWLVLGFLAAVIIMSYVDSVVPLLVYGITLVAPITLRIVSAVSNTHTPYVIQEYGFITGDIESYIKDKRTWHAENANFLVEAPGL